MEQKFNIAKLGAKDNAALYKQILGDVLVANPKTVKGQRKLADCMMLYINHVANKHGLSPTYSFWKDKPLEKLNESEKKALKLTDTNIRFGEFSPPKKHMAFNDVLLHPQSIGDFAYYVGVIAHEFQHAKVDYYHDFFNDKTPDGVKQEFSWAVDEIDLLREHLATNTELYDDADRTLFRMFNNAVYSLDDNEISARQAGLQAQNKFLMDIEKLAKKEKVEISGLLPAKFLAQNIVVEEMDKTKKQKEVINETKREMHELLLKITKNAKATQNKKVLYALAKTQDIQQFYNSQIFAYLQNAATTLNSPQIHLALDNSKYHKTPEARIKQHVKEYLEVNPNLFRLRSLLFNYDMQTVEKMASVGFRVPAQPQTFEIEPQQEQPKEIFAKKDGIIIAEKRDDLIVAKERESYSPMSEFSESYIHKLGARKNKFNDEYKNEK